MGERSPIGGTAPTRKRGHQHHPRQLGTRRSNVPADEVIAVLRGEIAVAHQELLFVDTQNNNSNTTTSSNNINNSSTAEAVSSLSSSAINANTPPPATDDCTLANNSRAASLPPPDDRNCTDDGMHLAATVRTAGLMTTSLDSQTDDASVSFADDLSQSMDSCSQASDLHVDAAIVVAAAVTPPVAKKTRRTKTSKTSAAVDAAASPVSVLRPSSSNSATNNNLPSASPAIITSQRRSSAGGNKTTSSGDGTTKVRKKKSAKALAAAAAAAAEGGAYGGPPDEERPPLEGAASDDLWLHDIENDPEVAEWSKLRCTSERTEVVAEREDRRQRRCADYPGLAFGRSIFSSDTMMKFSIIRNELHNIKKTQLKRVRGVCDWTRDGLWGARKLR